PGIVDRVVDFEPQRLAELVILFAVAGGDVHEPGTLIDADEIRRGDLSLARDPRVPESVAGQVLAVDGRQDAVRGVLEEPEEIVEQRPRDDVDLARDLGRDVRLRRGDGDREGRAQGPGRR